ncbi:MAG: hypothetical protein DMG14_21860 [Acidobacteria bacterium]|nr:MAG: hypothetical protein DMG14_21860 [Acidobacteriota bacterium]
MARTAKIVALGIGLAAFLVLTIFGFAVWVFIPLLPAGIVFLISVLYARRRAATPASRTETETDSRKAA